MASLKQAVQSGADCVYLGLDSFNARMKADNFTLETLDEVVKLCHLFDTKVFLTLNILIKPDEFNQAADLAAKAYAKGVDGIICADFGLSALLAKTLDGCDIVFSTQANIQNSEGCREAQNLGINSVVLSRETDRQTIQDIRKNFPDINLEYFAHGALCVSVSGQCRMSSAVDAYSGNRGQCKQPCRQYYSCYRGEKKVKDGYLLSTKDLCLASEIDDLKKLGINRIKIEGRNRRSEYVGQAAEVYRKATDGKKISADDVRSLKKMYNRGDFTKGYMYNARKSQNIMDSKIQGHKGVECGSITQVKDKFCFASLDGEYSKGDGFKIIRNGVEVGSAVLLDTAKGQARLSYNGNVKQNDKVHITSDNKLLGKYADFTKKLSLDLTITAKSGEPVKCVCKCKNEAVSLESDFICQKAENKPVSTQEIIAQFSKLGDTYFTISNIVVKNDDIFIPKAKLNEFRRNVVESITQQLLQSNRVLPVVKLPQLQQKTDTPKIAARFSSYSQMNMAAKCDIVIARPDIYSKEVLSQFDGLDGYYLDLPNFALKSDVEVLRALLSDKKIIGISANSLYAVQLAKQYGKKLFLNQGMNIFNDYSANLWQDDVAGFVYADELTLGEIKKFKNQSGFVFAEGQNTCMTLAHCPIQTNFDCTCSNCKYDGKDLSYKDKFGNTFAIKRKKLANCYFEVLNGHRLSAYGKLDKPRGVYLDLANVEAAQCDDIISAYRHFIDCGNKIDFQNYDTEITYGHLFKSVK